MAVGVVSLSVRNGVPMVLVLTGNLANSGRTH